MQFRIKKADLGDTGDAESIVSVLDSYASDLIGNGRPLTSDVRRRLIPGLQRQSNCHVWLACDADESVGGAVCFMGFSTFQARPLLNVHDLAVKPKYRGHGIGRALLHAIEAYAVDNDCCKLTLEVREDNERARRLYASFGFRDTVAPDSVPTRFLDKPMVTSKP